MEKKLLLFDWSGTISDDRLPVFVAVDKMLQHFGKPAVSYEKWLSYSCSSAIEYARLNGITEDDDSIQSKFTEFFKECVNSNQYKPFMYSHIESTLNTLKSLGKKMVVISSHPDDVLKKEAKEYGIFHYFEDVVGSVFDKTSVITSTCAKHGFTKEEVCYIGDTHQDVKAAKKAKVTAIAVWTGYHTKEKLKQETPDHLIEHVGFLPQFFE